MKIYLGCNNSGRARHPPNAPVCGAVLIVDLIELFHDLDAPRNLRVPRSIPGRCRALSPAIFPVNNREIIPKRFHTLIDTAEKSGVPRRGRTDRSRACFIICHFRCQLPRSFPRLLRPPDRSPLSLQP